jgi:hypothetical protein
MRHHRQLAAAVLLTATATYAQIHSPQVTIHKKIKPENLEWLWQYSPSDKEKEGRENDLLQDARFQPLLKKYLTAPQAFWGTHAASAPGKPLADAAIDFLAVPGTVLADQDRYLTITGCVFHLCYDRGLLWIDLNSAREPLLAFAAIDWTTEDRTPDDPASTYTLWLFPSQALSPNPEDPHRIPPALLKALTSWTAQPASGSKHLQHITTAVLVDPDGTPHQLPPKTLGIARKEAQP